MTQHRHTEFLDQYAHAREEQTEKQSNKIKDYRTGVDVTNSLTNDEVRQQGWRASRRSPHLVRTQKVVRTELVRRGSHRTMVRNSVRTDAGGTE